MVEIRWRYGGDLLKVGSRDFAPHPVLSTMKESHPAVGIQTLRHDGGKKTICACKNNMGERNSVHVFNGPTIDEFREALSSAVADVGGMLDWDAHPDPISSNLLTSHNHRIHAAYIHRKEYEVAKRVGSELAIPWINIRIQEGSLWDYSLFDGERLLDNFSTLPEYWGHDAEWTATQRGNPDVLANTWRVEQSAIERYLKPWGYESDNEEDVFRTKMRGKAYPSDQYEYGDIWQMTDFLRSLGAYDPNFDQPHCVSRGLEVRPKKRWWQLWRR